MKNKTQIILILCIIGSFMLGMYCGILATQKEYENSIKFVWEGLEKDIPKDGEYIQISITDENVIYLNPIDK